MDAKRFARRWRCSPTWSILDIGMPLLNGIEATRQIARRFPDINILILSMHAEEAYIIQAMKAGARGYLLKDSADTELIRAVAAVAAGKSFFSPAVAKVMLDDYVRHLADKGHRRPLRLAVRTGAGNLSADRRSAQQQGDRRTAVSQPRHGRNPSRAHPAEARRAQHRRTGAVRGAPRASFHRVRQARRVRRANPFLLGSGPPRSTQLGKSLKPKVCSRSRTAR